METQDNKTEIDLQAMIDGAYKREGELIAQRDALLAENERLGALAKADSAGDRAVAMMVEELAGLRAQVAALEQVVRDVVTAPISDGRYSLEPAGGWPRWYERVKAVSRDTGSQVPVAQEVAK